MTTNYAAIAATLALTFTAATAVSAADTKPMEKCYGVSLAGKNDCKAGAGTSCAGTSHANYQGDSWKYVAKGTCVTTRTPKGFGSLTPKS